MVIFHRFLYVYQRVCQNSAFCSPGKYRWSWNGSNGSPWIHPIDSSPEIPGLIFQPKNRVTTKSSASLDHSLVLKQPWWLGESWGYLHFKKPPSGGVSRYLCKYKIPLNHQEISLNHRFGWINPLKSPGSSIAPRRVRLHRQFQRGSLREKSGRTLRLWLDGV